MNVTQVKYWQSELRNEVYKLDQLLWSACVFIDKLFFLHMLAVVDKLLHFADTFKIIWFFFLFFFAQSTKIMTPGFENILIQNLQSVVLSTVVKLWANNILPILESSLNDLSGFFYLFFTAGSCVSCLQQSQPKH